MVSALKASETESDKLVEKANDFFTGTTVKEDEVQAFALYKKAAAQNHPVAQAMVGYMTYLGLGTTKDEAEGEKLLKATLPGLKNAAVKGDMFATIRLARLYERGVCIEQDEKQAIALYRKAAEKNESMAQLNLGVMYEEGLGGSRRMTVKRSSGIGRPQTMA
jgi:TPR repeat protein